MPKTKKESAAKLKKQCWNEASKYFRLRDALWYRDNMGFDEGYCKCISCDSVKHIKAMDAGHYVSRKFNAGFVHEQNVHAQCKSCNQHGGMAAGHKYGQALDEFYGEGTADRLGIECKIPGKVDADGWKALTRKFKEKRKMLEKELGGYWNV